MPVPKRSKCTIQTAHTSSVFARPAITAVQLALLGNAPSPLVAPVRSMCTYTVLYIRKRVGMNSSSQDFFIKRIKQRA